jgi:hypothetical protein
MIIETAPATRHQVPMPAKALVGTRLGAFLLAVIVAAATLPRAWINYGPDENGPNSAQAALNLARTGVYRTPRDPGNPLFDYLLALVVPRASYVGANLLVLGFYVLAVAAFACLVWDSRRLLIPVFALTPILLVNAVATIDYVAGLAMLLWAYVWAIRRRYVLAAFVLALAIGFRLPNALFLAGFLVFMGLRRERRRDMLLVAGLSLGLGLLFYVPILQANGLRMLIIPGSPLHGLAYIVLIAYNGMLLFGLVATVALGILLGRHWRQVAQTLGPTGRAPDPAVVLEALTVVLLTALFLLHADQTAYLLPVVPFLYLLLDRWLSPREWILLAVLIVAAGLITVDLKGGTSGRRTFALRPAWGSVVRDYMERAKIAALRTHVCEFAHSGQAVLMTGLGQALTVENRTTVSIGYEELDPRLAPAGIGEIRHIARCADRPVYLVYSLSQDNVQRLRADGYNVYIFSEYAPSAVINDFGYDPDVLSIPALDVASSAAFLRAIRR